jgi:hypothetical protein
MIGIRGVRLHTMRRLRSSRWAVVPALALLTVMAGCAAGPPPRVWAASVCSALSPWRAEINTLTSRAEQVTPQSASPELAKDNLVRMLEGARDASGRARDQVAAAGVPEVDDGEAIADGMVKSLTKIRDAYGQARDGVQALPTTEPATFYQGVAGVMTKLQQEYEGSALDTSSLRSQELKEAFAEVPECR